MRTCDACGAAIGDSYTICPLCGMQHRDTAREEARLYPQYKKRRRFGLIWRLIGILLLLAGTGASVIVNLAIGGTPWCLYVAAGCFVLYTSLLTEHLVEEGWMQRVISTGLSVALLLWVIERVSGSGKWASHIAVPMVLFGVLLICSVFYLIRFPSHRNHFAAPLQIIIGALCAMGFALFGVIELHWPLLVLAAFSLGVIVMTVLLYRKPFWAEFKKKIHM